ncbi:DUF1330 domain-containing protein [Neisseria chenwenguii]|uniref:Uncharacterized protein n=1 Tax=Neisseria chenwenguii TaxID=1853278 RepID=A0A220S472_9NEIS|nr:DUF1330 domain-containing protein [Neisseria chenwenguii]ASK28230.1 hypothetical protein BG910_11235 [Neisseria chenwenguii]ROV57354.1 DUF1330 domain-containing protein [Neisseria chenwenguii]
MGKPVYFIIDVKINDPEAMKPYQQQVAATFEKFGGRRLIAGGAAETLEGRAPEGKIVMVRFDSMEQAHAWHESPEYQAIIGIRHTAAESRAWFVEGVEQAV